MRLLTLTLSVTVYAVTTVLAAFMAGLALGAAWGGRVADRVHRPLAAYALVELGLAATGAATPAVLFRLPPHPGRREPAGRDVPRPGRGPARGRGPRGACRGGGRARALPGPAGPLRRWLRAPLRPAPLLSRGGGRHGDGDPGRARRAHAPLRRRAGHGGHHDGARRPHVSAHPAPPPPRGPARPQRLLRGGRQPGRGGGAPDRAGGRGRVLPRRGGRGRLLPRHQPRRARGPARAAHHRRRPELPAREPRALGRDPPRPARAAHGRRGEAPPPGAPRASAAPPGPRGPG